MALVLSDVGANALLVAYYNNTRPGGGNNHTLKLYTNDYTPLDSSTAGSFTVATGGGYADKALTNGSWTPSQVGGIQQVAYAQQVFTFTGALTGNPTLYGYYVVDGDGVLVYAERFAINFTPANNGDHADVTLKFQLSKGTPT